MGIFAFWSLVNCILGIIVVSVLPYRHAGVSLKLFAFGLLTLIYSSFVVFLWESGYMISWPHFFRTVPIFLSLTAPAFYLYVNFEIEKRNQLRWGDALHLIPAILYMVDYFPFLLSTADEKVNVIRNVLGHNTYLVFNEGWLFSDHFHLLARSVIIIIYLLVQSKVLFRFSKSLKGSLQLRERLRWLFILTLLEAIFSVTGFIVILFYPRAIQLLTNETATIMVLAVCILLLFKPYILYGTLYLDKDFRHTLSNGALEHPLSNLQIAELNERFKSFIQEQTFLHHDITLKGVADKFKTQPYILSAFVNQTYNMHFNGLINKHRIDYITEGLSNNKWRMLTLEAIGEKAGFNNRTTFFNAFKKFTGMTPSQFIKQIDENKSSSIALPDKD